MKNIIYLLVCLLLSNLLFAQQNKLTGTVVAKETGRPVTGATIKAGNNTVVSDANGNFTIQASSGDKITVTYVGMKAYNLTYNGTETTLSVQLEEDAGNLNQVVVTGYTSQKKKDITGAVSVVNMNETKKESNVNILNSIQGRIPGVVVSNDGSPGGTGFSVVIRGFSTTGSTGPLYVIDGVPTTNASALTSADIESMQVLKDAASATIYGARANNGVIIITTKKGRSPKTDLSFTSYVGIQQIAHRLHYLNTEQYGQALWQGYAYSGIPPSFSVYGNGATPVVAPFIDPEQTVPTANTDWIDELFHRGTIQSYNLGLNKATDKSTFYLGTSYEKNDGIQIYSNYDKFNTRLNSSFNVNKAVTLGENIQVTYFRQVNFGPAALNNATFQFPFIPVYGSNGNFGGPYNDQGDKRNPVAQLYNNKDNRSQNWRIFGNIYGEAQLAKGLNFRTSFGVDYTSFFLRNFEPSYVEGAHGNPTAYLTTSQNQALSYTWTNTLNYHLVSGNHTFDLLGGVEAIKYRLESFFGRNYGFIANNYDYTYLGSATGIATAGGGATENALLSQFGKASYSYLDKYLLSATVRRDGSSRFGANNRYAVFPAFSAGWRINKENFLANVTNINDLKLRASWGQTGNQEIGDYNTLDFFKTNADFSNYNLAGTPTGAQPGYYASQLGNPNLKWEAQTQTDLGLDFTGFKNHVTASVDLYDKKTSNLLINPALLAVAGGAAAPYINSGKVQNKGVELGIGYNTHYASGFSWSADFNIAFNKNKVLALAPGVPYISTDYGRIEPGHSMNEFYGYVAEGIFKSQQEIDEYAKNVSSSNSNIQPGLGRIRYKDLDGNGIIDDNDRTYIGNPNPTFNYGFNLSASYKGFDASVFLSGVAGNKIWNENKKFNELGLFLGNYSTSVLDAWTPTNSSSDIPALQQTKTNNEGRNSSYYVENGSYMKIKSIQIAYTFPKGTLSGIAMENLRLYIQGQNLFRFTKYTGMDPESVGTGPFTKGVDYQGILYPQAKAINFGVNVNF
jgi:TonB-linked SusC/RagA family outer membrane protein